MSIYLMTTSNQPDAVAERVDALPRLPRDHRGPVFAEPRKAQAFALAVKLSSRASPGWMGGVMKCHRML
jgi:hypothetical protein